jgi:hypothetical protein
MAGFVDIGDKGLVFFEDETKTKGECSLKCLKGVSNEEVEEVEEVTLLGLEGSG